MVELNVIEQVYNLGKTNIIQNAWGKAGKPWIHGWAYDLGTGLIKSLTSDIGDEEALKETCKFEMGLIGH